MGDFDFVTDEGLRLSLEADAVELASCAEAKAFKAVHVLAGSIVEAVLTDHLESIGYTDPKGKALAELNLGQLITAARSQGVLTQQTTDLASAVKTYRNLIHPGRLTRLGERVDSSTAAVAMALVTIVSGEVARLKRDTYGYTSQQVLSKLENDSSSLAILPDLLQSTHPAELEHFLSHDLPTRYLELAAAEDEEELFSSTLTRLRRAYRIAFDSAPEDVKRKVVRNYARILREEVSEFAVVTREEVFFRASDLEFAADEDYAMVKRHLISRIGRTYDLRLDDTLIGIGAHATESELTALVDMYVRYVSGQDNEQRRSKTGARLDRLWAETPPGPDEQITKRLEEWASTFAESRPGLRDWIAERRANMVSFDDLPELG